MKSLKALVFLAPIAVYNIWVLALSAQGKLPEPLATHWGVSLKSDGFSDVGGHLLGANFALVVAFGILGIVAFYPRVHPSIRKLLLIIVGYFTVFVTGLMVYVIWIQIGITDARDSVLDGWFIPLVISPILLLVPMMVSKPDVVLASDLQVKIWGLRFLRISYSEIASVAQEFVRPTQFGGWGIRFANGKVAFISSKGPALRIYTKKGEVILVRSNQVENLIAAITPKLEDK